MKSVEQEKKQLRRRLRALGRELTPEQRLRHSARAVAHLRHLLAQHPEWRCVASYIALGEELDLASLTDGPDDRVWCYPKVFASGRMEFFRAEEHQRKGFVLGPLGVLEPDPAQLEPCPADHLHALLIPAAGLSLRGERLGKGGGFYDRFLPRTRPDAVRIGVVFECQRLEALPCGPLDARVDWVVTEAGLWRV